MLTRICLLLYSYCVMIEILQSLTGVFTCMSENVVIETNYWKFLHVYFGNYSESLSNWRLAGVCVCVSVLSNYRGYRLSGHSGPGVSVGTWTRFLTRLVSRSAPPFWRSCQRTMEQEQRHPPASLCFKVSLFVSNETNLKAIRQFVCD